MKLTQKVLKDILSYDKDSGRLFWKPREKVYFSTEGDYKRWNNRFANKEAFFSTHSDGYRYGTVLGNRMLAHRVIYLMEYGKLPEFIDHIDGNRSNNSIKNLRECSRQENQKNCRKQSSKSGETGVRIVGKRFRAVIRHNYKMIHLGYYDTIEEAVEARKKAEEEYGFHKNHGTFRKDYRRVK